MRKIYILIIVISVVKIYSIEDYKNYQLPPVLYAYEEFRPVGSINWMQTYSIVINSEVGVNTIAYFQDGQSLLSGLNGGKKGGKVIKWDILNSKTLWECNPFPPKTDGDYMEIREVRVSNNGKFVLAIPYSEYGEQFIGLALINGEHGKLIRNITIETFHPKLKGRYRNGKPIMLQPWMARFSNDSKSFYVYYKNQYNFNMDDFIALDDIHLIKFDVDSGNILWRHQIVMSEVVEFGIPEFSSDPRWNFDESPNGKVVVIGDTNGEIRVIDSRTGRETGRVRSVLGVQEKFRLPGSYRVYYTKFNPKDNDKVYCVLSDAGRKATIGIANLKKMDFENYLLTAQTNDIPKIDFSSDGRIMAVGYDTINAWDMNQKMLIYSSSGRDFTINPLFMEFAVVYGGDVAFIHKRTKKDFSVANSWLNTEVYVSDATAFLIDSGGERFKTYIDIDKSFTDTYFVEEYYHKGWSKVRNGAIFLRSDSKKTISIFGGLSASERDNRNFRKNLEKWGNYPSTEDYGGRVGLNSYQSIEAEDTSKRVWKETEHWKNYKFDSSEANNIMFEAVVNSNQKLLEASIKRGADVNIKTEEGTPILCIASEIGNVDVIDTLILYGGEINQTDGNGLTPVMYAVNSGKVEAVRFFVETYANLDIKDKNGLTVYQHSLKQSKEIQKIIRDAGGR